MSAVDTLRCRVCASLQDAGASGHCARCFGPLEPVYDWERLARTITHASIEAGPRSLWRYEALLPVAAPTDAGGGPGWTPLVSAPRLAEAVGVGEVLLKLDHTNPTHSFKDRVVAVAAAKARELGRHTLRRPLPAHRRAGEAARDGRLRRRDGRGARKLRRLQQARRGALGRARLGVRQRQPTRLLRRGLEDARLRD